MAKKKLAPRKAAPKKASSRPQKTVAKKPAPKKVQSAPKSKSTLRSSSKPVKGEAFLNAGDFAPHFSALNEKGAVVSSKSLLGKKLVLYFYPKDDTPGCTQESCDFRDNFARVKKSGAEVFGVSKDSVKSHEKFKEKHGFQFSLLSDEDGKICEAFGVWKEKNLYGRKYMGIERTTFLVDENGQILKVYPKVKVKGHVDQVLEDLK